jgi:hypothetical protein
VKVSVRWGAIGGGAVGAAYALLRVLRALHDPTGPGGALEGMEANFPGNDGAVIFEMLPFSVGLIAMGAAVGAIGAWLLRRSTRRSDVGSSE